VSRSSTVELETGASLSHPNAAGLKEATLRAPIASAPQMSGSVGVASQPDVETEFRRDVGPSSGSEMDLSAQSTQPPHHILGLGMVPSSISGYHDISSLASTSGFHRMTASDDVTPGTAETSNISHSTAAMRPYREESGNPSYAYPIACCFERSKWKF